MVYKLFDKNSAAGAVKREFISIQRPLDLATRQLAKDLHNQLLEDLKNGKYTRILNICDADLACLQLIIKYKKGFRF